MRLIPVRARGTLGALLAAAVLPAATYAGATPVAPPPAAARATRVGAAHAGQDSTRLSDANILAKEAGGDSAEVAIARVVEGQHPSAPVRAYAALLIHDHSTSLRKTESLARRLAVTPAPPPGDTTAQETAHVVERLRALHGQALDTAFVQHEIMDHEHDIADAHRMEAAAHDAHVKALVRQSLPVLQKHLDRARQLAK